MRGTIRKLFAATCILGLALSAPSWSATEVQASPGAPPLEELEEVVLHGKRMERRLLEGEMRFYKRYNAINEKPEFAVTCDYWYTERDPIGFLAMARKRGCVPAYFAVAVNSTARARQSDWHETDPCSFRNLDAWAYGHAYSSPGSGFEIISTSGFRPGSSCNSSGQFPAGARLAMMSGTSPAVRPDPQLVYMSRLDAFRENLAQAIRSDAELRDMAGELDALAAEGAESRRMLEEYRKLRMDERRCAPSGPPRSFTACRK